MSPNVQRVVVGLAVLAIAIGALLIAKSWRSYPSGVDGRGGKRGVPPTAEQIAAVRAPLLDKLAATERPVARVALKPMNLDDLLVSKVGGAPYLPAEEQLPTTPNGTAMVLLAQVRFADLPKMDGYPEDGMFQIFIDPTDKGAMYGLAMGAHESGTDQKFFRTRFYAAPLLEPERLNRIPPRPSDMTPHRAHLPQRMFFTASREPITPPDVDFAARMGVDPYTLVEEAAERFGVDVYLLADEVFASGTGHKVGGYPYFTQSDPRAPDSGYVLFLQIDSDDGAQIIWGDVGVGNVFVRPDDLARGDFSRVLYNWDCH